MYETGKILMRNTLEGIPPVIAYLQRAAELLGLNERECYRIGYALEETLQNTIRFAFEADEEAEITVTVSRVASGIEVIVEDQGMPRDPFLQSPQSIEELADEASFEKLKEENGDRIVAISEFAIHRLLDHYRYRNLGKQGRRIEMLLYTHSARVTEEPETEAQIVPSGRFERIRFAEHEDIVGIARLFYKSYGYSYVNDIVYYPERLEESIRSGSLISAVALSTEGRVIGHIALMQPYEGATITEWGMAISDPAYRGQGIMSRLLETIFERVESSGYEAVFAHSVTNHAFTQKICQAHDFADVALLLGYASADLSFKKIHGTLKQRESTVISYKVLRPFKSPALYLPSRHKELITDLYAGIGVTLQNAPSSPESERPAHSQLQESVVTALNIAEIVLECAGADLPDHLGQLTRKLCIAKLDLLYLFIDLEAPEAPEAVAEAEALGYFFAGIFPRYHHRHSLVLQYLNNLAFDYETIVTLSPISEKLKTYLHDHDPNQIEE